MDCAAARRLLREVGGPAGPGGELAEARAHARGCPRCQEWQEAEVSWRAALRQALSRIETPLRIKERVFSSLAGARVGAALRKQRRRWTAAVLVLTLAGSAAAGVWFWRERARDGLLVAALAEDHLLYAARSAPAEFTSSDPGAVARWFSEKVDFAVAAPAIPGADLLGGRLCTLADRRATLWLYSRGDRRLSLFQMAAQGLPLGSMRVMRAERGRFRCGHRKGVSVLAWVERDVLFALVSDLPEEEMLRLARDAFRG